MRKIYKMLVGKPEGYRSHEDLSVDGMIILDCNLKDGRVWTGFIWLKIQTNGKLE
jgi:hypothetical protein